MSHTGKMVTVTLIDSLFVLVFPFPLAMKRSYIMVQLSVHLVFVTSSTVPTLSEQCCTNHHR